MVWGAEGKDGNKCVMAGESGQRGRLVRMTNSPGQQVSLWGVNSQAGLGQPSDSILGGRGLSPGLGMSKQGLCA